MRRAFAIVIAVVFAWSAFVDNAAVCADDALAASSQETAPCSDRHGSSDVPCLSCPCRLPSTAVASAAGISPLTWELAEAPHWPEAQLHTIDPAAPPTPPPLA